MTGRTAAASASRRAATAVAGPWWMLTDFWAGLGVYHSPEAALPYPGRP
jgi:hypothetical protein